MLVSHKYKFIFIKTSKTAGTSVEAFFEQYCLPLGEWELSHSRNQYIGSTGMIGGRGDGLHDILHSHMSAKAVKKLLTPEQWDTYFKFSVVRNPFDRLVSRFFFEKKKKNIDIDNFSSNELRQSFSDLVQNNHFSQLESITINNNIVMDFLIRYENLQQDVETVCSKIGVEFKRQNLPHFKGGIRLKSVKFSDLYTKDLIEELKVKYADELAVLSYSYPND